MSSESLDEYRKVNTIIERDSTDATYKFALLRGAIEISREYSHFREEADDKVRYPLGLLIEKWILYYYPLVASEIFIPQKNGETFENSNNKQIQFRSRFSLVTTYYERNGGFSKFFSDYRRGQVPEDIHDAVLDLCRSLRTTITSMPMKHLGYSFAKSHYSVFEYTSPEIRFPGNEKISRESLIRYFGSYSISRDLDFVFQNFGGFISGENAVLFRWAQFCKNADKKSQVSFNDVLTTLTVLPVEERDTWNLIDYYLRRKEDGHPLTCIWSGKPIHGRNTLHIDHLLPFSIWKNNDLWNLFPSLSTVNSAKSDRIPSPDLLESRKEQIFGSWNCMSQLYPGQFTQEIRIDLLGQPWSDHWQDNAFRNLKEKCRYLIEDLGYEEWTYE